MTDSSTFTAGGASFAVTDEMVRAYQQTGFVLIRGLLTEDEISLVRKAIDHPAGVQKFSYGRTDADGRLAKMCMWQHPAGDVTGVVTRIDKVAGTMEQLMGGDEVYHYHTKLLMKEAKTGGAFEWHQDYGYWYYNGCLRPEMGSVFMPVDECKRENGCLQVMPRTHELGRLDHHTVGQQLTADPARLQEIMKHYSSYYIEMSPGDVLFFHSNVLHRSSQNNSDSRRYVLITAFNKKRNNPVRVHHLPQYNPIHRMHDSALLQCTEFDASEDKKFINWEDIKKYNNV